MRYYKEGLYLHSWHISFQNVIQWNTTWQGEILNHAICSKVDGTVRYYAELNKSIRERQIPHVFTLMWILRNLTEDHGGGEGKRKG